MKPWLIKRENKERNLNSNANKIVIDNNPKGRWRGRKRNKRRDCKRRGSRRGGEGGRGRRTERRKGAGEGASRRGEERGQGKAGRGVTERGGATGRRRRAGGAAGREARGGATGQREAGGGGTGWGWGAGGGKRAVEVSSPKPEHRLHPTMSGVTELRATGCRMKTLQEWSSIMHSWVQRALREISICPHTCLYPYLNPADSCTKYLKPKCPEDALALISCYCPNFVSPCKCNFIGI